MTCLPGRTLIRRFLHGTAGQDLVEYALLAALIGAAAAASAPLITAAIGASYSARVVETQDHWRIPDPAWSLP